MRYWLNEENECEFKEVKWNGAMKELSEGDDMKWELPALYEDHKEN